MSTFDRDDLESLIGDLVARLRESGSPVGIRIVGGAALALRHFERSTTTDIDVATIGDSADLERAVAEIAEERGLPANWLNDAARKYIPSLGRDVQWHVVYDDDVVVVEVAPADALLAMKLHANRPGRDEKDIARLVVICDIRTIDAAQELYEDFYPGDALTDRAIAMMERVLAAPAPTINVPPVIELP